MLTASLNQAPFLERALASVRRQVHDDVEHLVADGGSTDGSVEILSRHRMSLAELRVERDAGPADALNRLAMDATGELLGVLNADDAYLPPAVRRAAEEFDADPSLDVVYGDGWIVDADGRILRRFRSGRFTPRRYVMGGVVVMHQATFVRAAAFRAVGGFNTQNRTCWDGELLLDLALAGARMKWVPELWGVFTLHSASITGSGRLWEEFARDHRRMFHRAIGRPLRSSDRVLFAAARLEKWFCDPRGVAYRLRDLTRRRQLPLGDDARSLAESLPRS